MHKLSWFVRRQPSAYRAKTSEQRLCQRLVHWDCCATVCTRHYCTSYSQRALRHQKVYKEFVLINQTRSSNLGFRTLRAEKTSAAAFMNTILSIHCISSEFCWYDTLAT